MGTKTPLGDQKNFLTQIFFTGHRSGMETYLHAKNQKKISNGLGCRTGTDERTDARTHESEFIGSFRSLKTIVLSVKWTIFEIIAVDIANILS